MTTPLITIYVRHSAGCKYAADEFAKRCDCRKWLRWTPRGEPRKRIPANTRSWAEAEQVKRDVEDQLAGRSLPTQNDTKTIRAAADLFITGKEVEGLTADLIGKYKLWLGRLTSHCEAHGVYTVKGISGELIITFCRGWETQYPSALTRSKLRERYKSFMRFCQGHGWVERLPAWPKIQTDDNKAPTMPLTDDEYGRLLDAVYVVVRSPENAKAESQTYKYWVKRVRGLFLLMRWSGLNIMDALTLPRTNLYHADGRYRLVTKRTKTGTDVSVILPPHIATELLAVPNDNDKYLFWSGTGNKKSICGNWGKRFIAPCFAEARIEGGYLKSHRLRDTFAVDLLQKGVALEDVSKLLGHRNSRITEKHYAPWVKGRQDRLDAVLEATWSAPTLSRKRSGRAA